MDASFIRGAVAGSIAVGALLGGGYLVSRIYDLPTGFGGGTGDRTPTPKGGLTPEQFARQTYGRFDLNRDDAIDYGDSVFSAPTGKTYWTQSEDVGVEGDFIRRRSRLVEESSRESISRAYEASKGTDAIASFAELAAAVSAYDKDADGRLSRSEAKRATEALGPVSSLAWHESSTTKDSFYRPSTRVKVEDD